MVLLVLALGKMCLHKGSLLDVDHSGLFSGE